MTPEIKKAIADSVLCWLATSSLDGIPNVSPKEVFCEYGEAILVANIASPQTVRNIKVNKNVCISFIDILVQKGFQVKGLAYIIKKKNPEFEALSKPLLEITQGKYPFTTLTKIEIESIKPIIAPSYKLFPEMSIEERVNSARKSYGLIE